MDSEVVIFSAANIAAALAAVVVIQFDPAPTVLMDSDRMAAYDVAERLPSANQSSKR